MSWPFAMEHQLFAMWLTKFSFPSPANPTSLVILAQNIWNGEKNSPRNPHHLHTHQPFLFSLCKLWHMCYFTIAGNCSSGLILNISRRINDIYRMRIRDVAWYHTKWRETLSSPWSLVGCIWEGRIQHYAPLTSFNLTALFDVIMPLL